MLFFWGRINRKTFLIGTLLGLAVLGAILAIIVVPLALIDIIVNGPGKSEIFSLIYYVLLFPIALYGVFFVILMVRRIHDIGYPGIPWVILLVVLEAGFRLFDIWPLNLAALLIMLLIFVLPGQKVRNQFGPKPRKRFRLHDIRVNA